MKKKIKRIKNQSAQEQNAQSSDKRQPAPSSQDQSQAAKQARKSSDDEQDDSSQSSQALPQSASSVEPELRKLEQVEAARDPSQLLRAQMILQAKQKQAPLDTGKKW